MRIASWNVNSVRARQERLLRWLERQQPDVLCLQELKVSEDEFPLLELRAAGYHAAAFGQKTYNGVAILSRVPPEDVRRGLAWEGDDGSARLIEARVGDVRVWSAYVPNGQRVDSPKFTFKLAWLAALAEHLDRSASPSEKLVLCGDLNVAPDDRDVAFPQAWSGSVLCHPDVRGAFGRLRDWGWVDVVRRHHPEGGVYSWWDYRMLGFPKGDGLRIDHVLASPELAERCSAALIDRQERKGKQPSDHAPVVATFDL